MESTWIIDLAWLGLSTALCLCLWARRRLYLVWLGEHEAGHTFAFLRIACGLLMLAHVWSMQPLHAYLFTDEGLLLTDAAQEVLAKSSFVGTGDPSDPTEPSGFFDLAGAWAWFSGRKHSLLLFWDDPRSVRYYLGAFTVGAIAFTLGLGTRFTKWAAYFLWLGLIERMLGVHAGEQVMLPITFCVVLSRCGEELSLDACLRKRASERVPAWPRYLLILQVALLWGANGMHKSGAQWRSGDAAYYMMRRADLSRWDLDGLAASLSPWALRVATWAVHLAEICLPLVLLGLWLRRLERDEASPREMGTPARVAAALAGLSCATIAARGFSTEDSGSAPVVALIVLTVFCSLLAGFGRRVLPRGQAVFLHRWPWTAAVLGFAGTLVLAFDLGVFTWAVLISPLAFVGGDELAVRMKQARPAPEPGADAQVRRRRVVVFFCIYAAALLIFSAPGSRNRGALRTAIEAPFKGLLARLGTGQSWWMFAPTGAKGWVEMHAELITQHGERVLLGAGFAEAGIENSFARDKVNKGSRRIRSTKWIRKWHLRSICRSWARAHAGALPLEVSLAWTVWTIPSPEIGGPAQARPSSVTADLRCATSPHGQLPPEQLARIGVSAEAAPDFVQWRKGRYTGWRSPSPSD